MTKPSAVDTVTRAARHVCPCGWISTLVSRPGRLVVCGCPERTSFHTGWLLSGCVCCCAACALGEVRFLRVDRRRLRLRDRGRRLLRLADRGRAEYQRSEEHARRPFQRIACHRGSPGDQLVRLYSFWFWLRFLMTRSHSALLPLNGAES